MGQVVYPYSMLLVRVGGKEKTREKLIPATTVRSGYRIDKWRSTLLVLKGRSELLTPDPHRRANSVCGLDCSVRGINEVTPTAPAALAA